MESTASGAGVARRLSLLDRWLPLWIVAAMGAGLGLGAAAPGLESALGSVAIGVFGASSGAALAGVVGPLIEVPALLGLVYVSLGIRRRWLMEADPGAPVGETAAAEAAG
jgi:ACR3 family arsenite efflux pump ArsB